MIWKLNIPKKYPFYILKENLCMIPINNLDELKSKTKYEDIYIKGNFLYSDNFFSLYEPSGPKIHKSTNDQHS